MSIDHRPADTSEGRARQQANESPSDEQLRREHEVLSLALESAGMVAWAWDLQTDHREHSAHAGQVLGLPPETVLDSGAAFFALVHPDDQERVHDAWQRARDRQGRGGQEDYSEEFRLQRPDGSVLWVADRGRVSRDNAGEPARMSGVLTDISARKQAEVDTERALERAHSVLSGIAAAHFVLDTKLRFVHVNDAASRLMFQGKPTGELLGRSFSEVFPGGEETEFCRRFRWAVRNRCEVHFEAWSRSASIWIETHAYPQNGHLQVYARDITRRRDAEQAMREFQERFEAFMDNSPAAAFMKDQEGRYVYVNRAVEKIVGASPGALLGKTDYDIFPEDVAQSLRDNDAAVLASGRPEQFFERVLGPDGERCSISFKFPIHSGTQGTFIGGNAVDITAQIRVEDALKEADRRKDEFLATLAHELRNPLAPILNAVHILRLRAPAEPRLEWVRDVIDRQAQQLTRLVDDLLDVSRITRGKIELRKERIDIATVLEQAVETSRPLLDRAGHELSVHMPATPAYLDADVTRLAQIVANLLNNAAKYTRDKGHIWLSASHSDGEVIIRVRDTGVGIAPELLPRVFDMFAQVDTSLERAQGGLGIGLTLVKSLVEMHGGTVEAYSDGLGEGCEFVVRLPATLESEALPQGAPGRDQTSEPHFCRVVVVDDNVDAADSLGCFLELLGHEVRIAHDGATALKLVDSYHPDVMVLDLGMPGLSGYDVAERIRARPELGELCLVALTGWGQEKDRRRTRAAGFDEHLVKPVDHDALRDLLTRFMADDQARA